MIKKFYWILVIIFTLYILLIFKAPNITIGIEKMIGLSWFTEYITTFKWKVDNLPSKDDIENRYNEVYSWAVDLKENIQDWINTTKDKIDSVRVALSWAEDTYNKAKDTYDSTINFIEWANDKLNDVRDSIDKVTEVSKEISDIIWSWTIEE